MSSTPVAPLDLELARELNDAPRSMRDEIVDGVTQDLYRGRIAEGDTPAHALAYASAWRRSVTFSRIVAQAHPPFTNGTPSANGTSSRPRERRSSTRTRASSSSSDDPDPPLGPGVVAIAAAARLIREGQQLSLWADRP